MNMNKLAAILQRVADFFITYLRELLDVMEDYGNNNAE